jgi:hypothetical protein
MHSVRIAGLMSGLLLVSAILLHAVFLALNWRFIVTPESSPCFSSGAPFGDCEPPFGGMGLGFPLYACLANALLVVPISVLAAPRLRRHSCIAGLCLSTLTFAALVPVTLVSSAARESGAVLIVLLLGLSTVACFGLLASLRLQGLARLTGATCLVSISAALYLFPFAFWLTFD